MKRFSLKTVLIGLLALSSFLMSVSPALANCDGWAVEGSSHRNAGNGCSYTCSNGSWAGPSQCDGSGNGQFQGEAARTAEERERQARAVSQRNAEARAKVESQGAAETAKIAANTAEQRAVEATRQQAMVENQRQMEVSLAARFGASAEEIAAINTRAQEAATFVSQAQGTDRGANLVGSDSQTVADIAARGYEATSSLATGVTVVQNSSQASVGGGTGGGSVATTVLYQGVDACDILAPTNGDVVPGGKCCRGGNVECASGTCSAGSIGQIGVCSGGDAQSTSTNIGPTTDSSVVSVAFRGANGQVSSLPVVSSASDCSKTSGTRSCAYQGRFVCVSDSTYSDSRGGCGKWDRDMAAQSQRGSSETIVSNNTQCSGNTRGCMYGGGWVCVDKNLYPVTSPSQDSSNGCAAWQRDFTRTQNGGSVNYKIVNGDCRLCETTDNADVCKYSTSAHCSNALAVDRAAASRYRLLSGAGTSCIACTTTQDAERYDCRYSNSSCDGLASAATTVANGSRCSATPGTKCFCSSLNRAIDRDALCPDEAAALALSRLPQCAAINGSAGITTRAGNNRTACLQNGVSVFKCRTGNAANSCDTTASTTVVSPTSGSTTPSTQSNNDVVTDRATEVTTVSPTLPAIDERNSETVSPTSPQNADSCVSSAWTEITDRQECCSNLQRTTFADNKTYCVNEQAVAANTLSVSQSNPNPVCTSPDGCYCTNQTYNTNVYEEPQTQLVRSGEACPRNYNPAPRVEACGSSATVPYNTKNSAACSTETHGLRGKCVANYHAEGERCVANNLGVAAVDLGNAAVDQVCRLSGYRLPLCNQSSENVSPSSEEASADTSDANAVNPAQNTDSCGGSFQPACEISSQGQSVRVCDQGYVIDTSVQGGVCQLDVKAIANDRDTCGGNLEARCDVFVESDRAVQSCDSGSLYNANINLCVPALYSGVPACATGTLYDSQSLTNLTACYSGSGTARSLKYYCPNGVSCTQPGQTVGVNGCSLTSARANAVSCGFSQSGAEIFRCEHGPGRQENGQGSFVCPVNLNGQLAYYFPTNNQTVTQPSFDSLYCQNRANGSYTVAGYSYNCCNSVTIPRGQQCVATPSESQTFVCPETGCAVTPHIATASDAVIGNATQRWACLMTAGSTQTQAQSPLVCMACDGTGSVTQVSCSSLRQNNVLPVQQFENISAIREAFPNATPEYRE